MSDGESVGEPDAVRRRLHPPQPAAHAARLARKPYRPRRSAALAFGPDSTRLAVAGVGPSVTVWDVTDLP